MNTYKIKQIKNTPAYRMLQYNYQKMESDFLTEAAISKTAEQMYEDMMDAEWRINTFLLERVC